MSARVRVTAATVAAVVAGALLAGATPAASGAQVALSATRVTIPVRDGVTLSALVQRPATGRRLPLLVVPGPFSADTADVDGVARQVAERGWVVVTYSERGLGDSTGQIEGGGPLDVADASDVITWALRNTPADPERIGVAGVSYGAGLSVTVAATDRRVKAAAMVDGWADMWRSRYPNRTNHRIGNVALWAMTETSGTPNPRLQGFFKSAIANRFTDEMRRVAAERSAVSYLPQLRKRAVPLYVSTTMNEQIWPADQAIDFFDAYPGVKHLDVLPGDHTSTEIRAGDGVPGDAWESAMDWMDTWVAGTGRAARGWAPVRVSPRGPHGATVRDPRRWEGYRTAAPRTVLRRYLTGRTLGAAPGTGRTTLHEGENLVVNNGVPLLAGYAEVLTGNPPTVPLALVDRRVTGLWSGPRLARPLQLRGPVRTRLELTPSAARGSVFVYLLDTDGLTTYVVGHKPYSWSGATPGTRLAVDVTIPYQAYDVPAGHRLVVGVSTGDGLYTDNNPRGARVAVGAGSFVELPVT